MCSLFLRFGHEFEKTFLLHLIQSIAWSILAMGIKWHTKSIMILKCRAIFVTVSERQHGSMLTYENESAVLTSHFLRFLLLIAKFMYASLVSICG